MILLMFLHKTFTFDPWSSSELMLPRWCGILSRESSQHFGTNWNSAMDQKTAHLTIIGQFWWIVIDLKWKNLFQKLIIKHVDMYDCTTYGCIYLGMFTSKAMGRTFGGVFIYVLHLEWQKKHKHQSRGVTKLFFNINISKVFCWPVREKNFCFKTHFICRYYKTYSKRVVSQHRSQAIKVLGQEYFSSK